MLDLLDLADADAGDPDVVALLELEAVVKIALYSVAGAEADVAHDRGEQAGDEDETTVKMPSLMPAEMVTACDGGAAWRR